MINWLTRIFRPRLSPAILSELLLNERWPEMALGCRACQSLLEMDRPEACGACHLAQKRRQQQSHS